MSVARRTWNLPGFAPVPRHGYDPEHDPFWQEDADKVWPDAAFFHRARTTGSRQGPVTGAGSEPVPVVASTIHGERGTVEAVLVRDGRVAALGGADELRHRAPDARVIDLSGGPSPPASSTPTSTSSGGWVAEERVSMDRAWAGYTTGAARAAGDPRQGRLAPGSLADLVAWDRDPFEAGPAELLGMEVELTMVEGEVVWMA